MNDNGVTGPARIYWVDNLSAFSVFKLALLTLADRKVRNQTVCYLSANSMGIRLLRVVSILARALGTRIEARAQDYDLYDFRTCNEKQSTFEADRQIDRLQQRVAQVVVEKVNVEHLVGTRLKRRYSESKVRLFLVQSIANEVYGAVLSLSVMHRLAVCTHDSPGRHTLLISRSVFYRYILSEHPASKEVRVESYIDFGEARVLLRSAAGFARQLLVAQLAYAAGIPGRIKSRGRVNAEKMAQRPRIAVQYTQGTDLHKLNDLFWLRDSGLLSDQVLVYFDRKRFPMTEAAVEQLEGLGVSWMTASGWKPGVGEARYLRDLIAVFFRSVRLAWSAPFVRSYPGGWLWRAAADLERRVSHWSAFLREHGIAVHIHHVANTPIAIPMVFAAENAGAIDFGYQWSASEFIRTVRARITASHIFFAWGDEFVSQMRQNALLPDVYLVGGNVFGHFGLRATDSSMRTRTRLKENGCEYVICMFDSGFRREIHYTPKLMVDFYLTVLRWVLEDRTLGLVIKPKASAYQELPGVEPLVDKAIARGQCVVEDATVVSFEAAMSADIAVGVGINTAVLEARLAGVPGVHFDLPEMMKAYPGIRDGMGRFVFRDGAELYAAIQEHRQSGGKTTLGDHGDWLKEVDPFQDGKAAQRMGNYLRWYLESIEAGRDSKQAVADATARYSREIGPQYVISGLDRPADAPLDGTQ